MRTLPELQFESSYIEEGVFNVLISPREEADDRRYTVEAEPVTRQITHIFACQSRDEGIFEMDFRPSEEDLAALRDIVENCRVDADDGSVSR